MGYGRATLSIKTPQNTTTIDSFTQGFAAINRRPWLLVLPILLTVYIWFGAPLSFAPLLSNLTTSIHKHQVDQLQGDLQKQYDQQIQVYARADMRTALAVLNFIPTLTTFVINHDDPTAAD